jgi:hypothetical protein
MNHQEQGMKRMGIGGHTCWTNTWGEVHGKGEDEARVWGVPELPQRGATWESLKLLPFNHNSVMCSLMMNGIISIIIRFKEKS